MNYARIALEIIIQALKDMRHVDMRPDVFRFFDSDWFDDLCDFQGFDPDMARARLPLAVAPPQNLRAVRSQPRKDRKERSQLWPA